MNNEYWHEKWQLDEIGFNQASPSILLQNYFSRLNIDMGARVFVPLCGKSIDMLWLVGQGYQVVGIELSRIACEAFFKEHDIPFEIVQCDDCIVFQTTDRTITLFCGNFFRLNKKQLGPIDVIYDRAALIALPADLRRQYVNHLLNLIDLGSKILLITMVYDQSSMSGPPFSLDEEEVRALYRRNFTIKLWGNEPIKSISPHLKSKGLLMANEQVFELLYSKL